MPTRTQSIAILPALLLLFASAVAQPTGTARFSSPASGSGSKSAPTAGATPIATPPGTRTKPGSVRVYSTRPSDTTPLRTGVNTYRSPRTTGNRPRGIAIPPGVSPPAGVAHGITQPPSTLPPDIRTDSRYTRNWRYPGVGGQVGSRGRRHGNRHTDQWIDMGAVPANRYYYAPGWGYTNHTYYLGSRSRSSGSNVAYRQLHASPYRYRSYIACPWYQDYYYPTHPRWDNATWYAPGFALKFSYRTSAGYWNTYFGYGYGAGVRFGDVDWLYSWYPFGGFVRMSIDDVVPREYTRYVAPQVYYPE